MIPAARALIGWSYAADGRHVGKVVVIQQDPAKPAGYLGPRGGQRAEFTTGACNTMWMGGHPKMTPEGAFGEMLAGEGFATPADATEALRQFAMIDECGWARAMLAAVE